MPCADQSRQLAAEIEALFDQRLDNERWQALLMKLTPMCDAPAVEKRANSTVYRTTPKHNVPQDERTRLPVWVGIDWYRDAHQDDVYLRDFLDPE